MIRVADWYWFGISITIRALKRSAIPAALARNLRLLHKSATLTTHVWSGCLWGKAIGSSCSLTYIAKGPSAQSQCRGKRDRRHHLCRCQHVPPEDRAADNLLRHDDDVPGIKLRRQHFVSIPFAGAPSDNASIRAHDENLLSICKLGSTSRTAQIPTRIFSGDICDCRCVINLAADKDEAWPLWNRQHIAGPEFDICIGIGPTRNVTAYFDHQ